MGKTVSLILAVALMFSVALVGCGPEEAPPPAAPPPAAPPPAAPPPAAPPPAAPPPPPPPVEKTPWEKLVEAAKDEGTVNVYIVLGAPTENAIKEGFKAKYGIAVETVTGRPPTVHAKLVEEQIAGVYIADMYLCGSSTLDDFWAAGYSQAPLITPPSMEDRGVFMTDPYDMDPEGKHFWILESPNASVLINTNLVKEGEITSYQDLMDPKWTGQIVMTDPRVPGPGNSAMFAGMRVNSLDWWKEFANKQQPLLERNHQRPIDAVVLGEKSLALYISNSRAFGAMEAGGPVKLIHLKEGSHVPRMGGAIPNLRMLRILMLRRCLLIGYYPKKDRQQYVKLGESPPLGRMLLQIG